MSSESIELGLTVKICFVSLYSYPLFDPTIDHVFGGSEVRSWMFAQILSKSDDLEISYVVFDHGQSPIRVFGNITVHSNPFYLAYVPSKNLRLRISRRYWDTIALLRNRRLPSLSQLFSFCLIEVPILTAAKLARKTQETWDRFFGGEKKESLLGDRKIEFRKTSVFHKIDADVYCIFGVSDQSADLAGFCKTHGKKFVLFAGSDEDFSENYRPDSNALNNYGSRSDLCYLSIVNADIIVVQTAKQALLCKERFGLGSSIIRNPIDLTGATRLLPREQTLALWVGKSDPFKNPNKCVELATKFPEIKFLMIINKSYEDLHQSILDSLPKNVTVIEKVPFCDVESYFKRAFVLINTSEFEGFPNTFLQAGKFGVPILSWKVDPDGWIEKENCGLVAHADDNRFQKMFSEISEMGPAYERYSSNIRKSVSEKHDLEKNGRDLHDLFLTCHKFPKKGIDLIESHPN